MVLYFPEKVSFESAVQLLETKGLLFMKKNKDSKGAKIRPVKGGGVESLIS